MSSRWLAAAALVKSEPPRLRLHGQGVPGFRRRRHLEYNVLLAALNREARARGLFASRAEPDLRHWLDLAAMGAVCDVTQLVGFNRALTSLGLRVLSQWRNPGLAALMDGAAVQKGVAGVFEAGFILGPRINAGGRVGRSDLGARLLATDDPREAAELAACLETLNAERKAIEHAIVEEAALVLERDSNFDPDAPLLLLVRGGLAPGCDRHRRQPSPRDRYR